MIIPSKHEKLNESLIVLGAEILNGIKKKGRLVEDLFNEFKVKHPNIHLDNFFLTLVFLWLVDAIKKDGDLITYK